MDHVTRITYHVSGSTKHVTCYPTSTTGSPKALIPKTCKRPRHCWRNSQRVDVWIVCTQSTVYLYASPKRDGNTSSVTNPIWKPTMTRLWPSRLLAGGR